MESKSTKKLPMQDLRLKEKDPEMFDLITKEKYRQWHGIELIASENFTSTAVMECLGSCLTNKYSEGYPGGNEYIDQIERLCQKRALEAFGLNSEDWGVNVQPYSGSPANLAAYTAILGPGERLMGLDLTAGGHLTHGYQTEKKKISATSLFFESKPYSLDPKTGHIDYDECQRLVSEFKPKLLICGLTAYPRDIDYKRFREIADSVGAYLLADIAHISGLIAKKEHNDPFPYCDIVSSTTHKTLRGPRAGMIFARKNGAHGDIYEKVNFAVFPMLQGGPHNNQVAALAVQLKEVQTEEFHQYVKQIKLNAKALAEALMSRGHKLVTDGTENHQLLWDLRPHKLTGSKIEKALDLVHITVNKNTILGDKSAMMPGGVRVGTPAVTTRGMKEADMEIIADFMTRAVKICEKVQEKAGKNIKDFIKVLETDEDIKAMADEVKEFSMQFEIPGFSIGEY